MTYEVSDSAIPSIVANGGSGYIGLEIGKDPKDVSETLLPRLFQDAKGRLKIRANNQLDAQQLM